MECRSGNCGIKNTYTRPASVGQFGEKMKDLVKIEDKTILEFFSTQKGLDPVLDAIKTEINSFVPDMTTNKGRKEIASIANKIARSKTYLDNLGKELVSEWKSKSKLVDSERKRVREELDKLKEEVRRPLTMWENEEKERVEKYTLKIESLKGFLTPNFQLNSNQLKMDMDSLEAIEISDDWQEFKEEAIKLKERGLIAHQEAFQNALKVEKEQAELEALRKEKEERDRKDREEKIKKEAAEAARKQAEEKAKAEKERLEKQAREAAEKAEKEKQEVIRRQKEAEENAKRLEKEKIEAAKRAEEEKKRAEIQAAERERKRIAEEKAEQERQERIRQENIEHRKKINNEVLSSMKSIINVEDEEIKKLIKAIANGEVPHTVLRY